MAYRAIITRYSDEIALLAGNFTIGAYFIATDPLVIGSGKVLVASPIPLDASNPTGWTAAIKAAVVAHGIDQGCTDLTVGNTFAPAYV